MCVVKYECCFKLLFHALTNTYWTCHWNPVGVFQESTWHEPVGNRKQSCDLSRWCKTSHVGFCQLEKKKKVPLSPLLLPWGISREAGDMLMLPGNLCTEQPLHEKAQCVFLSQSFRLTCTNSFGAAGWSFSCLQKLMLETSGRIWVPFGIILN